MRTELDLKKRSMVSMVRSGISESQGYLQQWNISGEPRVNYQNARMNDDMK